MAGDVTRRTADVELPPPPPETIVLDAVSEIRRSLEAGLFVHATVAIRELEEQLRALDERCPEWSA